MLGAGLQNSFHSFKQVLQVDRLQQNHLWLMRWTPALTWGGCAKIANVDQPESLFNLDSDEYVASWSGSYLVSFTNLSTPTFQFWSCSNMIHSCLWRGCTAQSKHQFHFSIEIVLYFVCILTPTDSSGWFLCPLCKCWLSNHIIFTISWLLFWNIHRQ